MNLETNSNRAESTLRFIRKAVLFVLFLGFVGVGGELVLLEHYEDIWQKIPLFLIAGGIVVLLAHLIFRRPMLVRLVQLTMLLCVCGSCVGLYLHYKGNSEFELEMYPSRKGMELFWESVYGATPALAPAALLQLGILGLVYTFRHPFFGSKKSSRTEI